MATLPIHPTCSTPTPPAARQPSARWTGSARSSAIFPSARGAACANNTSPSARTIRKEGDLAEPCLDLEFRIIQPKVGRDAIGKEREAHFEIGQPFRIVEIEIACMGVPPRKLFQQLAALHARSGRGRTGPGDEHTDALFFLFRPVEIDLLKNTIAPPHRLDPGTHGSNGEKRFRAERNHFLAFPFDGDAAILAPARDAAFTAGQFTPQILRQ